MKKPSTRNPRVEIEIKVVDDSDYPEVILGQAQLLDRFVYPADGEFPVEMLEQMGRDALNKVTAQVSAGEQVKGDVAEAKEPAMADGPAPSELPF